MADRGWFGRGRSAHTTQQQVQSNVLPDTRGEAGGQAQHASLHRSLTQVPLQQNHHHKAPKISKISSFIGLGNAAKAQSPTGPLYPELIMERSESLKSGANGHHVTSVDGGGPIGDWQQPAPKEERKFPNYKEAQRTWHNPSLKQMVETVSCTMMKNGSSAPIPRHLNGWIAGIVEEVSHQTSELESMRVQIAELKATRQEEVIEFSKVTEEWAEREKNFKAEINRLEHIISDTQQGAESVMLARAESVVNRNDGRAFRAKLERLSRSDEGDGHALEESHPADDNLVEQGKRKCVALSPGDVGLTINTTPYEVLESTPSLLDDNDDIHLSKQLRDTTPRRDRKEDQDLSANLVAARIAAQTTGKPPAPSVQNSNDSSSQSSSGNASYSSSLIAQGLAKVAQAKVTPHTSPTKDENLCGRPVEEPKKARDVLGTIRQLAAQNCGLPDNAIDNASGCSSVFVDPRAHRAFSFSGGDDRIVSDDETTPSIPRTSTNVGNVESSSRRPLQLSAVQEQALSSQLDGAFSGGIPSNASGHPKSDSSSSSSHKSQRRSHASMLRSMGHNHATGSIKEKAAADELKKLKIASVCSPMIVAMAKERSVPSPSKKVQEDQVPRRSHLPRLDSLEYPQGRAFISDEELALTPNRQARDQTQVRARGHKAGPATPSAVKRLSTDVAYNQEAAFPASRALKRSTSGQNGQNESRAQAA